MRKEAHLVLVFVLFILATVSPAACIVRASCERVGVKDNESPAFATTIIPRGGSGDDPESPLDDAIILRFLDNVEHKGKFFIQGWRWHTMSLLRDAGRLEKLALRIQHRLTCNDNDQKPLERAADYVVDFNMKGLHRIEQELFFPWLRKKLTTNTSMDKDISKAFSNVMDEMDLDREKITQIGVAVVRFMT